MLQAKNPCTFLPLISVRWLFDDFHSNASKWIFPHRMNASKFVQFVTVEDWLDSRISLRWMFLFLWCANIAKILSRQHKTIEVHTCMCECVCVRFFFFHGINKRNPKLGRIKSWKFSSERRKMSVQWICECCVEFMCQKLKFFEPLYNHIKDLQLHYSFKWVKVCLGGL